MRILVTGSAGFIGSALSLRLLSLGHEVIGIDNLCDYYDVALKKSRLDRHIDHPSYRHHYVDLSDRRAVERVFAEQTPQRVVNLAAQAGVRYGAENPHIYASTNMAGFLHVLEGCRNHGVQHLVFASSSSVYGANNRLPFSVHQSTEHPLSLYAATKKANEMMAHSYAHLFGLPCTGLRFFTVYGPWGRPDMAPFQFTRSILAGEPIRVFNHGKHKRDFTYIDDVVEGVVRVLHHVALACPATEPPDPATSTAPYRLYNIGNQHSVELLRYIQAIEECVGRKAQMMFVPMQPGDMPDTEADVTDLHREVGQWPFTTIETGTRKFVDWYRAHYQV